MEIPFELESDIERAICGDPTWQEGADWGEARPGHPEGAVIEHIAAVLRNLDERELHQDERAKLRIVALAHDTFKYQVDRSRPRVGMNHHPTLARKFLEAHVRDEDILEITELHDEAFNSWAMGNRKDRWDAATERATHLIERLGGRLPLYLAFYRADNETEGKDQEPLRWFEELVAITGT